MEKEESQPSRPASRGVGRSSMMMARFKTSIVAAAILQLTACGTLSYVHLDASFVPSYRVVCVPKVCRYVYEQLLNRHILTS